MYTGALGVNPSTRFTEPRQRGNIKDTINKIIHDNTHRLTRIENHQFAAMDPPTPAPVPIFWDLSPRPPPQPDPPRTPLDALLEPYIQTILQDLRNIYTMLNRLFDKLAEHADEPEYARVFERMLEILLGRTVDRHTRNMGMIRRINASSLAGPVLIGITTTIIVVHEAANSRR